MHSYIYKAKAKGEIDITFHFDGGLSGEVIIQKFNEPEFRIPARALIELVAYEFVLPEKIGKLEGADAKDILLGFEK